MVKYGGNLNSGRAIFAIEERHIQRLATFLSIAFIRKFISHSASVYSNWYILFNFSDR